MEGFRFAIRGPVLEEKERIAKKCRMRVQLPRLMLRWKIEAEKSLRDRCVEVRAVYRRNLQKSAFALLKDGIEAEKVERFKEKLMGKVSGWLSEITESKEYSDPNAFRLSMARTNSGGA